MLYIASVPGFILAFGMQFAVDSPRWLCKVGFCLIFSIGAVLFCLLLRCQIAFICSHFRLGD